MGLIQLEGPPFWRWLRQRYFRGIKSEAFDVALTDLEQWMSHQQKWWFNGDIAIMEY